MPVKLSSLQADIAKEQDGELIAIPDLAEVSLRVRSLHYRPYVVARDLAFRRLAKRFPKETPPEDETARVVGSLLAEHILLGWEGFDTPYSGEMARELLTDVGYRKLREHVVWAATQVGERQVEFLEDAEKN